PTPPYDPEVRSPLCDADNWPIAAPPWRQARATSLVDRTKTPSMTPHEAERAQRFVPVGGAVLIRAVNAALLLRRPLLVRGDPGLGKSSLALHLAWHFGLGRVLRWEINSRTTLESGLYHYDAVAHLHGRQLGDDLGQYIRLGPLGTALLPTARPRVLLID